MPGEELTNTQIALLCDIGQAYRFQLKDDDQADADELVRTGYIEVVRGDLSSSLRLTEKASTFLSARGASLNES